AKKYQIEVEEEEQTPEQIAHYNERESLLNISEFATKYFVQQIWETEKGKSIGLGYLTERGISTQMIKTFELGYSPDEWTAFTDHAIKNAHAKELLQKTGLTILKENGKKFDRFKGRIMFPIHNLSGQVIGFGGRTLSNDKKQAKYLNSPESDLYHKSKILYGITFARNEMVRQDNCFLVEGYTDVISLFDAGVENVVASSGTALTVDQIKLIKRFTPNITILYDGDFAGIKAGLRGIDMILSEGMNVRVVLFPDGEDPDSYARSHRSSEVQEYITKGAQDFIRFKTGLLSKEVQNDPIKKAGLIKEIVQTISIIPDPISRQVYVKECSTLMEMPEQTLLNELNKKLRNKYNEAYKTNLPIERASAPRQVQLEASDGDLRSKLSFQEENLARLLLEFGHTNFTYRNENGEENELNVAAVVIDQLEMDNLQIENPIYLQIYQEYVDAVKKEEFMKFSYFVNHSNPQVAKFCIDVLSNPYELSPNWMERKQIKVKTEKDNLKMSVLNSILSYKLSVLEKSIKGLQKELKEASDETIMIILSKIGKKENQKKLLSNELGRTILK
ncbi:MAG: DNA primase, partial [Bacteroidales bacterium]|nr:DNA primase [Bacteroidales bacterium]